MPLLDNDMETHQLAGGHFGFSATRIDTLGASEYTLVTIAADTSGSISGFEREIEGCLKSVVEACKYDKRADNLMLRLTKFHSRIEEVHGFKPLADCKLPAYDNCIQAQGSTVLYDAATSAIEATIAYGRSLSAADFAVNAIVFVITDGENNGSIMTAGEVKKALERAVKDEAVESIVSVLVGINVSDPRLSKYLSDLQRDAGFTQYVELKDAGPKTLAKLASFTSKSISAQSQALGTGGPSQALTI